MAKTTISPENRSAKQNANFIKSYDDIYEFIYGCVIISTGDAH